MHQTTSTVGSSFPASSVRLTAQSQVGSIQLNWNAFVPWSNQIQSFPNKHRIYRGPEGATESELVLIDSVDVLADGFMFVDQRTTWCPGARQNLLLPYNDTGRLW